MIHKPITANPQWEYKNKSWKFVAQVCVIHLTLLPIYQRWQWLQKILAKNISAIFNIHSGHLVWEINSVKMTKLLIPNWRTVSVDYCHHSGQQNNVISLKINILCYTFSFLLFTSQWLLSGLVGVSTITGTIPTSQTCNSFIG